MLAALDMYNKAKASRKENQYVDFTCLVQGIEHVVAGVTELPNNYLCIVTVIEEGTTSIIYAPATQVCFQIVAGEGKQDEPPREIGFKPLEDRKNTVKN
jgi:hypothetical protein